MASRSALPLPDDTPTVLRLAVDRLRGGQRDPVCVGERLRWREGPYSGSSSTRNLLLEVFGANGWAVVIAIAPDGTWLHGAPTVGTAQIPRPLDADSLQGHPASYFRAATDAVDAATLNGLPASAFARVPTVYTLAGRPAADASLRGVHIIVSDPAYQGGADVEQVCLRQAGGTYTWTDAALAP